MFCLLKKFSETENLFREEYLFCRQTIIIFLLSEAVSFSLFEAIRSSSFDLSEQP